MGKFYPMVPLQSQSIVKMSQLIMCCAFVRM